jgi:hypothetical protein
MRADGEGLIEIENSGWMAAVCRAIGIIVIIAATAGEAELRTAVARRSRQERQA